ncbi:MAG: hypothetical protein HYR91_11075 [Flavobacteriia bacterium]|nr:hypothetical protein [Flavobacteriia bacterium]
MINIDLLYLYNILIPIDLRKDVIIAFIEVIHSTMNLIFISFYNFFDSVKYDLSFNGQVISLEELLNNKYDPITRGIYIDDTLDQQNTYLYNKNEENEHTYLFNKEEIDFEHTYLFNKEELDSIMDFTIFIPSSVVFTEIQLRKIVDKYKLPSKQYLIEII